MGLDYTASITMVETYYPGTSVEPLVSFPGAVPEGSEFLDSMKPFESATVLKAFPRDDMPFDQQNESVQPVLVPFSLLPGKNEDVFRQITNAYRDEEVRFPGQVDAILEAGYPLLLPYYLVEFADDNPAYTGTKVCLTSLPCEWYIDWSLTDMVVRCYVVIMSRTTDDLHDVGRKGDPWPYCLPYNPLTNPSLSHRNYPQLFRAPHFGLTGLG